MKILISLLCLLMLMSPSAIAANGSFLILKSVYLYPNKEHGAKKFLTRKHQAYDVVDIYKPKNKTKSLMYQILFFKEENIVNGSGFIVETEEELKDLGIRKVRVYLNLPKSDNDLTDYYLVPSNRLSFTGRQLDSEDFPNLSWKMVNFTAVAPLKVWVPEWAGIYRPDKDEVWLNDTYNALIEKEADKAILNKILLGLVETGYTEEQVRLTLGQPVREQQSDDNNFTEWIYNGRKIIFKNGYVTRVL